MIDLHDFYVTLQTQRKDVSLVRTELLNRSRKSWLYISLYKDLKEIFIQDFIQYVSLHLICKFYNLSDKFLRKNFHLLSKRKICKYQCLTKDFMEKYSEYLDWNQISRYQLLSPRFVIRNFHKVNWKYVKLFQRFPNTYVTKHLWTDVIGKHHCAICLNISQKPSRLVRCGHTFCFRCIDEWVSTGSKTCPCCRRPIGGCY